MKEKNKGYTPATVEYTILSLFHEALLQDSHILRAKDTVIQWIVSHGGRVTQWLGAQIPGHYCLKSSSADPIPPSNLPRFSDSHLVTKWPLRFVHGDA